MKTIDSIKDVRQVIDSYIAGTKTGNVKRLKEVFHGDAIMSGNLMGNIMVCSTTTPFFKDIEGETAPAEYDAQITSIVVDGNIASATLIEKGLKGTGFINHFHLVKIEGTWKIVSKLFISDQH